MHRQFRLCFAEVDRKGVAIKVEWLDGGNANQQRVRYTVTTTDRPVITSYVSSSSYIQSAASTMPIAH